MSWETTQAAIAARQAAWERLEISRMEVEAAAPLPRFETTGENTRGGRHLPHPVFVAGILSTSGSVLQLERAYLDREAALDLARWILETLGE